MNSAPPPILPVILAGGAGSRLHPLTSAELPKPFLPLASGGSLLSRTCARIAAPDFAPPLLIGAAGVQEKLRQHAGQGGVTPGTILLEPASRNTALAIAVAAAHARRDDPQRMLAILPCDHHVAPLHLWHEALMLAARAAAARNRLCLLAVPAREPRAGLGYLQLERGEGWRDVRRFIEKPADPAALLARGGEWAWNTGQFVATAECFAGLFRRHAPRLWDAAEAAVARAAVGESTLRLDPAAYATAESISFDHAVAEHAEMIAVAPALEWDDLGTLAAWEAHERMLKSEDAAA